MALSAGATVVLFVVGLVVFAFVLAFAIVVPSFALWLLLFAAVAVALGLIRRAWRRRGERREAEARRAREEELRRQPPVEDALGRFVYDRGEWTAKIAVEENWTVFVRVLGIAPEQLHTALARDRKLVESALADDTKYRLAAADLVLKTYNEVWREGLQELDREGLAGYLKLRTIRMSFDDHYAYVIFHANSFLFGGHRVELVLDAKHEPIPDIGGITDER